MCDQDYTVAELNTMQQQLFCALDFDLGAPLSYRFLRRFARVSFYNSLMAPIIIERAALKKLSLNFSNFLRLQVITIFFLQ